MGNCVSSLRHPCRDQIKSDASSEDVVTKPDTEVLLRAAIIRSLFKTSVPSKQRLAAASRFDSSTLMFLLLLALDLLSVVDRDAVLQCRKHVILWRTLRDRTLLTFFSLTPTVCESAAPPCVSSTLLYAIRFRHLSRLPKDFSMQLFSCLQWFFEDATFFVG